MSRNPFRRSLIIHKLFILPIIGLAWLPGLLSAKVVRVEITGREVVTESAEHGQYDPYEEIKGIIYLEVEFGVPVHELPYELGIVHHIHEEVLKATHVPGALKQSVRHAAKAVSARAGFVRLMQLIPIDEALSRGPTVARHTGPR